MELAEPSLAPRDSGLINNNLRPWPDAYAKAACSQHHRHNVAPNQSGEFSASASGESDLSTDKCDHVSGQGACGAPIRLPEGGDASGKWDHRHRAGACCDHAGEHGLQYEAVALVGPTARGGVRRGGRRGRSAQHGGSKHRHSWRQQRHWVPHGPSDQVQQGVIGGVQLRRSHKSRSPKHRLTINVKGP